MVSALSLVAGVAAMAATPAGDRRVTDFNYVIGTQTFGVKYTFTKDTSLVETAKAIREMGSNVLKISMEKDYAKQYPDLPANPKIRTLVDLARLEPSYRAVLRMPFSHILLWTYPFDAGWWADGLSEDEREKTYRQHYDLTAYLLRTFSGSGKTFYLGHWEGDWHLHPSYDPSKDPSDTMIRGMADWLNARQKAIEDAKRDTPHRKVAVYGYTEVNLVQKAMKGGKTLTNDVLPLTTVDFVSYSSYDSLTNDPATVGDRLKAALQYVENRLPPKPGIEGKRVFLGEYGFPTQHHTPENQENLSRAVCRAALEWGCRFALYWEMYCNEKPEGKHRGFWMIDDKGAKQPVYHMHARFYREAKDRVAAFLKEKGRLPTEGEFRKIGVELLR
ncbi:MAG: hypothetical protein FJX72_00515 [Armatimonadetes bacterium]|nr:hypothetical protein [Armatimonadota bacterium]